MNEIFETTNKFSKKEFEYIETLFNKVVETKTKNLDTNFYDVSKNFKTYVRIGYLIQKQNSNAIYHINFDIFKGLDIKTGSFNKNDIEIMEFDKDFIEKIENIYKEYDTFLKDKDIKLYNSIEKLQNYLNQL